MESLNNKLVTNETEENKGVLPQNDFANECLLSFLATPKSPTITKLN